MIVSFALKNQIIRRTDCNIVVAQSRNYLRAKFNALTDDWNAQITAIFNEYTVILDDNNECVVPWEVLQNPGTVKVSAFCGDLHTASVATMVVNPSGYVDGQTPEPPTPDVYQTLVQTANNAKNIAQSVRDDADAGLFNGRPGEPGAAGQDGFSPIATVQQTADGATITITDKAGTTTATVKNGEPGPQGEQGPAGLNGQDAPQIDDTKITTANPWSSAKIVETVCPPFEVTGPIVTCNPVAGHPLHVVIQIVPVQEGEGDPSPDNVRPITGWTEANLLVGGKNLWDNDFALNPDNWVSGTSYNYLRLPLAPNTAYTLSMSQNNMFKGYKTDYDENFAFYIGDNPGTWVDNELIGNAGVNKVSSTYTFSTSDKSMYANLYVGKFHENGFEIAFKELLVNLQIEAGSVPTKYTPYNPASKTITLPFGQTVYGGILDWTTGVLTIKSQKLIFDGSENWVVGSNDNGYILQGASTFVQNQMAVCNIAVPTSVSNTTGFHLRISYNFFRFQGFADKYPDVDSFKAFLQTQNVEIAAELVTPITVQLTPQEILALSGVNTIYTDTGDTTVSGLADPVATLQQLAERIDALQSMSTAVTQLSELDAAYREGVNSV